MADEDQAADSAEGTAAEGAPRGKRKIFMIAGALVLALVAGGGGWYVFLRGHDEHAEASAKAAPPPVFLEVPEVLVNLAANPGERIQYLKVKTVLELKEAPLAEKVKPSLPRVTDLFQTYLRELRANDLNGSIGLFRMKEELTKRVNAVIAPEHVNAVLFKEVVIQ